MAYSDDRRSLHSRQGSEGQGRGRGPDSQNRGGKYGGGEQGDIPGRARTAPRYEDWERNDWDQQPLDPTLDYLKDLSMPGPFTGIGPRGYRRSDDRICEEVCERLTDHGQLDASEIDVEVKEGEVILSGTVADRRSKRLAEDLADSINGVKDVHNRLRVQPMGETSASEEKDAL